MEYEAAVWLHLQLNLAADSEAAIGSVWLKVAAAQDFSNHSAWLQPLKQVWLRIKLQQI